MNASLDKEVFGKFRSLVYQVCGISLTDQKEALVAARIGKRMRSLGIEDYNNYYEHVLADKSGAEMTELVNCISTNVTQFYREPRHFDLLARWVKEWEQKGARSLSIWSAACSTGEEPYTIAMTVLDSLSRSVQVGIMASDISTRVIERAKAGVYRQQDVEKIPFPVLKRYFDVGEAGAQGLYRVKATLRNLVTYQQINLSTPPYPVQGDLDVIFCKNVMIYFNNELRRLMVQQFKKLLRPGGYLVVGMAESLSAVSHGLKSIEPSVYQLA